MVIKITEIKNKFFNKFNPSNARNCPYCNAQNFNKQETEHTSSCELIIFWEFMEGVLNGI